MPINYLLKSRTKTKKEVKENAARVTKQNVDNIKNMLIKKPCQCPSSRSHALVANFKFLCLSYMTVCLTSLMVLFPLPESWMAVTPATLAIFWSQYGNGNRQP